MDLTQFDAALKQYYTKDRIINQVYLDNPLFALMSKMESFSGRNLPIVTIWGDPQGRSASFARAQVRGALTSSKLDDFLITRVKDYSIATVDGETMEASKDDMGAFLDAATVEIDGALNELTRSHAIDMYKSGYGERGQITGSVAGATIQLANVEDVTNFEVGQELDVAATLTGAVKAYGTSGNGLIITGVNRYSGVLTFAFNVNDATNGIPTIAAGDYLFIRGDHSGASRVKLSGLEAWLPFTAPTSGDNFFGVDRSQDPTRLAGQRLDGTGGPIEEVLTEASSIVAREGGKLTHYFMSFDKYTELQNALGSKVQYVDLKLTAEIAFRGIQVNGPKGAINVIPDQNCPSNRIFGLNMPTWKLYSLNSAVRILEHDGLMLLRQPSSDGVEVRCGSYAQMGSRAPGHNICIKV